MIAERSNYSYSARPATGDAGAVVVCVSIVASVCVLSFNALALVIISRIRRTPRNTRFLAAGLIVMDSFALVTIPIRVLISNAEIAYELSVVSFFFINASYVTVSLMCIERTVMCVSPMRCMQCFKPRSLKRLALSIWCLYPTSLVVLRYGICTACITDPHSQMVCKRGVRHVFLSVVFVMLCVAVAGCVKIFCSIRGRVAIVTGIFREDSVSSTSSSSVETISIMSSTVSSPSTTDTSDVYFQVNANYAASLNQEVVDTNIRACSAILCSGERKSSPWCNSSSSSNQSSYTSDSTNESYTSNDTKENYTTNSTNESYTSNSTLKETLDSIKEIYDANHHISGNSQTSELLLRPATDVNGRQPHHLTLSISITKPQVDIISIVNKERKHSRLVLPDFECIKDDDSRSGEERTKYSYTESKHGRESICDTELREFNRKQAPIAALKDRNTYLVFTYLITIIIDVAAVVVYFGIGEGDSMASLVSLILSLFNSVVDACLYVFWFEESKMELLKILALCRPSLQARIELMRIKIFNIVVFEHSPRSRSSTTTSA